jgi:hypothetical protein
LQVTLVQTSIVYIDRSDVRTGKLDEVKASITALLELVEPNEPQLLGYAFYLDEQAARMTVLAIHPDAESMELHMEVGAPGFQKFEGLIDLRSIDVYGTPSVKVREQLRQKAQMLGTGVRVMIHEQHAGFARPALRGRPR